jgi:D-sedoheptulose 7-phosphate isomerase
MGTGDGTLAADALVRAAERIAAGYRSGGRLCVSGSGRALPDVHHVVVEYQHPVTVGKRALDARRVASGSSPGPADVTLSIAYGGAVPDPTADVQITDRHGLPATPEDAVVVHLPDEPGRAKVAAVLAYHVVWELTHLFLEAGDAPGTSPPPDAGGRPAAAALYPMLYGPTDGGGSGGAALRRAAQRSARAKLDASHAVVEATLAANRADLERAAALIGRAPAQFTFGNGGSSTDATAAAHALGPGARSLTEDVATITALANDVAFDVVFARQLVTMGRPGDCAIGFSTSGSSANVIAAAEAAKRIGMSTVGLAGYDGGAMRASPAFDVVLVARSDSVHRIQEAQSAMVARLVELLEPDGGDRR